MEAIAATHGVYSSENTKSVADESGVSTDVRLFPNRIFVVDTTLSFAMKPLIRDVQIRQSPKPIGFMIGARTPPIIARILLCESVTILKRRSKLCRNHTIMVAIKMIEKALCRKSLAFSHRS